MEVIALKRGVLVLSSGRIGATHTEEDEAGTAYLHVRSTLPSVECAKRSSFNSVLLPLPRMPFDPFLGWAPIMGEFAVACIDTAYCSSQLLKCLRADRASCMHLYCRVVFLESCIQISYCTCSLSSPFKFTAQSIF